MKPERVIRFGHKGGAVAHLHLKTIKGAAWQAVKLWRVLNNLDKSEVTIKDFTVSKKNPRAGVENSKFFVEVLY